MKNLMRKLIALAVIASLFCGCNDTKEDIVYILDLSRPNEPPKRIQIPTPLVYDRHEYNITTTGAVVTIYFNDRIMNEDSRVQ